MTEPSHGQRVQAPIKARMMVGFVATVSLMSISMLALPNLADGCSISAHCYSLSIWEMKPPEELAGTYTAIEAYYGVVPGWASGEFITDETWVGFPQYNEYASVEGGVVIGNYENETTPYYFVARTYSRYNYYEEDYFPDGPPYNAWSGLYWDQPDGAGTWCVTWAWDSKPDFCYSGFPGDSYDVSNGMEFATTTSSGANNNGRNYAYGQWMSGAWHTEWNDGATHAYGFRNSPLCNTAPAPGYTWGSVAYSVPGC